MKPRVIVGLCIVLLVAGGVTWWALTRHSGPEVSEAGSASPSPSASSSSATSPSSPTSAEPSQQEGKPVARCATEPAGERLGHTFWGMHVTSPVGDGFPHAPIGAINLTTSQTYWYLIETAPGSYDFSHLDDIVATARAHHVRPMVLLGFSPSFHTRHPDSPTARTTMPELGAWRSWVKAVVDRYGSRLDYQIWPEPNISGNWAGTPRQMAQLSVLAADIIHARAPGAIVVAPATALRLASQQHWMDRFWSADVPGGPVADSLDAVALDPFPLEDGTPETMVSLVCRAEKILQQDDVNLPVWTNEINYGVPSGGHATGVQHFPDSKQAAFVARTYLLSAATDLGRVYWLGWSSYPGMSVEMVRDYAETPAATAYRTVHGWLGEGQRPECRLRRGVYECLASDAHGQLRIYWRERGFSTVHAEPGATRLETLSGAGRRIDAGERIRVGEAPVAVRESGG